MLKETTSNHSVISLIDKLSIAKFSFKTRRQSHKYFFFQVPIQKCIFLHRIVVVANQGLLLRIKGSEWNSSLLLEQKFLGRQFHKFLCILLLLTWLYTLNQTINFIFNSGHPFKFICQIDNISHLFLIQGFHLLIYSLLLLRIAQSLLYIFRNSNQGKMSVQGIILVAKSRIGQKI